MSDNNDFGNFFAGFIMGGLVGAAVALLLAPHSGEETRAIIKDRSIELKDKAVVAGQDARAKAESAMMDARARAETAIEDLRKRTDEFTRMSKEKAAGASAAGDVVLEEQKAMPEVSASPATPVAPTAAKASTPKKSTG